MFDTLSTRVRPSELHLCVVCYRGYSESILCFTVHACPKACRVAYMYLTLLSINDSSLMFLFKLHLVLNLLLGVLRYLFSLLLVLRSSREHKHVVNSCTPFLSYNFLEKDCSGAFQFIVGASLTSPSDSMLTLPSYSPKVLQSFVRMIYVTGYYCFSAYVTFHSPL